MDYSDRLLQVYVKRELRFADLTNTQISVEQATENAKKQLQRSYELAQQELEEEVVDLTTGKTTKRKYLQ